jgi:hypothetical protein
VELLQGAGRWPARHKGGGRPRQGMRGSHQPRNSELPNSSGHIYVAGTSCQVYFVMCPVGVDALPTSGIG